MRRSRSLYPSTPGAPSGGGGYDPTGGQPSGLPMPMVGGSTTGRFQRSIDQERALNHRSAATFAAGAPLPMTGEAAPMQDPEMYPRTAAPAAPATPAPRTYTGANAPQGYAPGTQLKASDGSSIPLSKISDGDARQTAEAHRAAYVDRQSNAADMTSGNYFLNKGLKQDWNTRENAQTGAGVAESGARTGFLSGQAEQTRQLTPMLVKQGGANADLTTSQAEANRAGVPGMASSLAELKKSHDDLQKRHDALLVRLAAFGDKDAARAAAEAKAKADAELKTKTHDADLKARSAEKEKDREAALKLKQTPTVY